MLAGGAGVAIALALLQDGGSNNPLGATEGDITRGRGGVPRLLLILAA
jgi:hypothetical protein